VQQNEFELEFYKQSLNFIFKNEFNIPSSIVRFCWTN